MPTHPILLLAVGLTLAACHDSSGPSDGPPDDSSTVGTLVVSTTSLGNDPDPDGYLVTVDAVDTLAVAPSGSATIDVSPGQHTLQMLGMAEHCSVSPETPFAVDVPARDTTSVAFEVTCSTAGISITTTTTGLDFDPDGYRLEVDGTERGILPANGTVLTRLDPGSRTIVLTGLSSNCAVDGSGSRTVTLAETEIVPIAFAVECTATSGAILVVISGRGVGATFWVMVDQATAGLVGSGGFAVVEGVLPGDHVVSLNAPEGCSVATGPQEVTVNGGAVIRDTVEVTFSTTCETNLRITAPTTGPIPDEEYEVWSCVGSNCFYDYNARFLGLLEPNGLLKARLPPGTYHIYMYAPPNCVPQVNPFNVEYTVVAGQTLEVELPVVCSP